MEIKTENMKGIFCHFTSGSATPRGLWRGNGVIQYPRFLFLYLQPILSPSILDHLINNDRKLPPEYNLPHTYVEMQVAISLSLSPVSYTHLTLPTKA